MHGRNAPVRLQHGMLPVDKQRKAPGNEQCSDYPARPGALHRGKQFAKHRPCAHFAHFILQINQ